jgi:hypothetical protein
MSKSAELLLDSSPIAKGKRLILTREMAGFTIIDFAHKHKIGYSTLKSWENGKGNGLSNKGARLIVDAMRKEGVLCDLQWLLHGKGRSPTFIPIGQGSTGLTTFSTPSSTSPEEEIRLFQILHPNAMVITIKDDKMEPVFSVGDIVGGSCLDPINFDLAQGKFCIVETQELGILCRQIQASDQAGLFNLFCIHPSSTHDKKSVISDVKPLKLAPIKRVWK